MTDQSITTSILRRTRYSENLRPAVKLDPLQWEALQEFHLSCQNREIEFEVVDCPICGDAKADMVAFRDRYGIPVSTALCQNCGCVYRKKRLAPASAELLYNRYYQRLYKGKLSNLAYFQNQKSHAAFIHDFLGEVLPDGASIVEFGCGPGGILAYFADQGFRVRGFDLDASYADSDIPDKPAIEVGDIDATSIGGDKPALVILSHLLEHTFSPEQALAECNKMLTPGGLLFIEVPGLRSFHSGHYSLCGCRSAHPYKRDLLQGLQLAHNFEFDLRILTYLLENAGFQINKATDLIRVVAKKVSELPAQRVSLPGYVQGNYQDNKEYLINLEKRRSRWALIYAIIDSPNRIKQVLPEPVKNWLRATIRRSKRGSPEPTQRQTTP